MKNLVCAVALSCAASVFANYAIVRPANEPSLDAACNALLSQHADLAPYVCTYTQSLTDVLPALRKQPPQYIVFLQPKGKADKTFVAACHNLVVQIDDDPYDDAMWGIISGALLDKITQPVPPLTIHRTLSNTYLERDYLDEARLYSELKEHLLWIKHDGVKRDVTDPIPNLSAALAKELASDWPQLLVTSAHATEQNLAPGFTFNGGALVAKRGSWTPYGPDRKPGASIVITNATTKVWLACGNCLIGHLNPKYPDTMADTAFNALGVRQLIGYTEPTWFGYMGWGVVDYFIDQPGRYTLAEAFFANHQALLWQQAREQNSQQKNGLEFDRTHVAFYGDPAYAARLAPQPNTLGWEQTLTETDGLYTFTITPKQGDTSFIERDTNGSQRGGRPIFQFLPRRIKTPVKVLEGEALKPVITDNFILIPRPIAPLAKHYTIKFTAAD